MHRSAVWADLSTGELSAGGSSGNDAGGSSSSASYTTLENPPHRLKEVLSSPLEELSAVARPVRQVGVFVGPSVVASPAGRAVQVGSTMVHSVVSTVGCSYSGVAGGPLYAWGGPSLGSPVGGCRRDMTSGQFAVAHSLLDERSHRPKSALKEKGPMQYGSILHGQRSLDDWTLVKPRKTYRSRDASSQRQRGGMRNSHFAGGRGSEASQRGGSARFSSGPPATTCTEAWPELPGATATQPDASAGPPASYVHLPGVPAS